MSRKNASLLALGLLALPFLAVGAASGPCQAQVMVSVGDGIGERGLISTRGFEAYCRILSLDEAQKAAARDLMDGASAANRASSANSRCSNVATSGAADRPSAIAARSPSDELKRFTMWTNEAS